MYNRIVSLCLFICICFSVAAPVDVFAEVSDFNHAQNLPYTYRDNGELYHRNEDGKYVVDTSLSEYSNPYTPEHAGDIWKLRTTDNLIGLVDNSGRVLIEFSTNPIELVSDWGLFISGSIDYYSYSYEGQFDVYSDNGDVLFEDATELKKKDELVYIVTSDRKHVIYNTITKTQLGVYDLAPSLLDNDYAAICISDTGYSWDAYYGLMDKNGNYVIKPDYQYKDLEYDYSGLIILRNRDYEYALYDLQGNIISDFSSERINVIDTNYYIRDSSDGYKFYSIDDGYKFTFPENIFYGNSDIYSDGYFVVNDITTGLKGLMDLSGNLVIEPQYTAISRTVTDKYASTGTSSGDMQYYGQNYKHYIVTKEDSTCGIVDCNNNVLYPFGEFPIYHGDAGSYEVNGTSFCFTADHDIVELMTAEDYFELTNQDHYYGYEDTIGIFVYKDSVNMDTPYLSTPEFVYADSGYCNDVTYDHMENADSEYCIVKRGENSALVDHYDNVLIPYDDWEIGVKYLGDTKYYYTCRETLNEYYESIYHYGLYDSNVNRVLPGTYHNINSGRNEYSFGYDSSRNLYQNTSIEDRYVIQSENDKFGFINSQCEFIVEPKYDYVELFVNGTAVVGELKPTTINGVVNNILYFGMIDVNGHEVYPCRYGYLVNGETNVLLVEGRISDAIERNTIADSWAVGSKNGFVTSGWYRLPRLANDYDYNSFVCNKVGSLAFNKYGYAIVSLPDKEYAIIDKFGVVKKFKWPDGMYKSFSSDSTSYTNDDEIWFSDYELGDLIVIGSSLEYGIINDNGTPTYGCGLDSYGYDYYDYRNVQTFKLNGKYYYNITKKGSYSLINEDGKEMFPDYDVSRMRCFANRFIKTSDGTVIYNPIFIDAEKDGIINNNKNDIYPDNSGLPTDSDYLPSDINNVIINGKGTAYGRFPITDMYGNAARNKTVSYRVDGGSVNVVKTDEYGYACVAVKNIEQSGDYSIAFTGNGVQDSTGVLKVTVKPLEFTSDYEAILTSGATAGVGIGVGGSVGKLEAEAKIAEVGVEGSNQKILKVSQEYANNKNKLTLTSKQNYDAAIDAKVGLYAEIGEEELAGLEMSVGELSAGAKGGVTMGVSYEDADFVPTDTADVDNAARFLLAAILENMTSNAVARYIAEKLDAPTNAHEKGSRFSLSAGASASTISVNGAGFEEEITLGGIDAESVWNNSIVTKADGSQTYESGIEAGADIKRLEMNIGVKNGDATFGTSVNPFNIQLLKGNMKLKAEESSDGVLKNLSLTSQHDVDLSVFWNKETLSNRTTISYADSAAQNVSSSYDKLSQFASGNKSFFDLIQMANAVNKMVDSDQKGRYAKSVEKQKGIDAELLATVQLLLEVGGKIGISGVSGYEYETVSGIYENGIAYVQAENYIDDLVEQKHISIDDMMNYTKDAMTAIISGFIDKVEAWIDDTADYVIKAGQASAQKLKESATAWKVGITTLTDEISSMSVLAVEDELSLFSTSSLATTIGNPYIVTVEDADGNEVMDLSENPLLLTLEFTEQQLADAGVTNVEDISVLRWDDEKNVYVNMGGVLDADNKCVNIEITKPGQYILAVDNCPPAITSFKNSGSGNDPVITAIVSDMSNIADFTFEIDGSQIVTNDNLEQYYDFVTGKFCYKPAELTVGRHTAVIKATDSFGNSTQQSVDFVVNYESPVIDDVSSLPAVITENTSVTAIVSGSDISGVHLNMDITDPFGAVTRSTLDMIENNGTYTADISGIPAGCTITAWVNAYNVYGNSAQSAKQTAVVIPCKNGEPAIAITGVSESNVSVSCANSENVSDGSIIIAIYNESGKLTQVKSKKISATAVFDATASKGKICAYLWNGSLKPLAVDAAVAITE